MACARRRNERSGVERRRPGQAMAWRGVWRMGGAWARARGATAGTSDIALALPRGGSAAGVEVSRPSPSDATPPMRDGGGLAGGGRRRGAGPRAGGGHADTRAAEAVAPSTATAAGARGGRLPGPARTACVRTDVHVSRDVSTHLSVSLVGSCSSRPVARRRAGPTLDLSSHVTQSLTSGHSPSSGSHVSRTRQGTCSVDFGLRAARAGRTYVAFPPTFLEKTKVKAQ